MEKVSEKQMTTDMIEEQTDYTAWDTHPPDAEPQRQFYYMELCRRWLKEQQDRLGRPLTAAVITFGCQMNARDSEKLRGILENIGYEMSDTEAADFVIYNT